MKLILILSTMLASASCRNTNHPVLQLHGFEGVQINGSIGRNARINSVEKCRRGVGSKIFPFYESANYLITHPPSCVFEALTLTYNEKTHTTRDPSGITTYAPPFGDTAPIDYLDEERCLSPYFIYLNYKLKEKKYEVHAAPYDFRKGISEQTAYFEKLKRWIEKAKDKTGKSTIIIVHSLGGIMIHHFLRFQSQSWKDEYVACLINVAPALGGGPNIIRSWFEGELLAGADPELNLPVVGERSLNCYLVAKNQSTFIIPPEAYRSWSSSPQLLPSPTVWNPKMVIIRTNRRNYTVNEFPAFLKDFGFLTTLKMYKDNFENATNIDYPGVNTHCMYGNGIPTPERVVIKKEKSNVDLSVITGDGDGLVNKVDRKVCIGWIGKGNKNVTIKDFPGLSHDAMIAAPITVDHILSIIDHYNAKNNS